MKRLSLLKSATIAPLVPLIAAIPKAANPIEQAAMTHDAETFYSVAIEDIQGGLTFVECWWSAEEPNLQQSAINVYEQYSGIMGENLVAGVKLFKSAGPGQPVLPIGSVPWSILK